MKVKVGNINNPLAQLEASKSVIKNLFKDFFKKIKRLKYQIVIKILLSKQK